MSEIVDNYLDAPRDYLRFKAHAYDHLRNRGAVDNRRLDEAARYAKAAMRGEEARKRAR